MRRSSAASTRPRVFRWNLGRRNRSDHRSGWGAGALTPGFVASPHFSTTLAGVRLLTPARALHREARHGSFAQGSQITVRASRHVPKALPLPTIHATYTDEPTVKPPTSSESRAYPPCTEPRGHSITNVSRSAPPDCFAEKSRQHSRGQASDASPSRQRPRAARRFNHFSNEMPTSLSPPPRPTCARRIWAVSLTGASCGGLASPAVAGVTSGRKDLPNVLHRGASMAAARKVLVLAVAAAVALLTNLTAGGASSAASSLPAPRFEPTTCPTAPVPTSLPETARCGFLIVPENRAKATGRTIRLTVGIVPAKSRHPAPDPIVYLAGGPGGYPLGEAQALIEAGFNRDRDLIIISQRGTLYAPPNPAPTCPEGDRAFRTRPWFPARRVPEPAPDCGFDAGLRTDAWSRRGSTSARTTRPRTRRTSRIYGWHSGFPSGTYSATLTARISP